MQRRIPLRRIGRLIAWILFALVTFLALVALISWPASYWYSLWLPVEIASVDSLESGPLRGLRRDMRFAVGLEPGTMTLNIRLQRAAFNPSLPPEFHLHCRPIVRSHTPSLAWFRSWRMWRPALIGFDASWDRPQLPPHLSHLGASITLPHWCLVLLLSGPAIALLIRRRRRQAARRRGFAVAPNPPAAPNQTPAP